jgi:hypothetical protein
LNCRTKFGAFLTSIWPTTCCFWKHVSTEKYVLTTEGARGIKVGEILSIIAEDFGGIPPSNA